MMQIIKDKWGNDEELKTAYLLNLARVRQIKKYMRDKGCEMNGGRQESLKHSFHNPKRQKGK